MPPYRGSRRRHELVIHARDKHAATNRGSVSEGMRAPAATKRRSKSLSAMSYGLALALDPSGGSVNAPIEMLVGSPFRGSCSPGTILLMVLGLGAILLATALHHVHARPLAK